MNPERPSVDDATVVRRAVEATIRIAVLGLLFVWCFQILRPFAVPIIWGIIIAVALHPAHGKLVKLLGGRRGLAAALLTVAMVLLLLVPAALLTETLVSGVESAVAGLREGTLTIPPPPAEIEHWPIIGAPVYGLWDLASTNLEKAIAQIGPQLKMVGGWFLSAIGEAGVVMLMFLVSLIVAGVLLAHGEESARAARRLAARLAGEQGEEFVGIAEKTVQSVALGILGVAVIQSLLAGLGLLIAGIPGAGLWALVCLLLAVMQIGPLPVMLLAAIYMFATRDTTPAVLFAIWAVVVVLSDNLLKPLLLGRGVQVPMLVILLGALGGFITSGIVGLFVGAVVLTLGYRLFLAWLEGGGEKATELAEPGAAG
jgi:predicted PurR-regulated permease PerM